MRKFFSLLITMAILSAGGILGAASPAVAHPGHSVSVNDPTGSEATPPGNVAFTLTLSPAPQTGETISVRVATADNTATGGSSCAAPGADYVTIPSAPTPTTITWSAGETTKTQNVAVCQDVAIEDDETFFLNLSNAAFTCVLPCLESAPPALDFQGVGTILDDEGLPTLSIGNRTADEGDTGTKFFTFPVTLSSSSGPPVTVHYETDNGTASAASDYQAKSDELTFSTTTTQNIQIVVSGDTTAEPDQTFFVNLSAPTNATISNPQGIGMILNDDANPAGPSTLVVNDVSANEGDSGSSPSTPFTFTVTLSRAPEAGVTTVNYHTSNGSATDPADYAGQSGPLQFTGEETAKTVRVPVVGDTTIESNENFFVNLSSAACTVPPACTVPSITDAQGQGTIVNDDGSPPPTTIVPTMKIGGYFQVRVNAEDPCEANRLVKVKQSMAGTDQVRAQGTTNSDGLYKEATRPIKSGKFYGQSYDTTIEKQSGTFLCKGGKSPIRTLPA